MKAKTGNFYYVSRTHAQTKRGGRLGREVVDIRDFAQGQSFGGYMQRKDYKVNRLILEQEMLRQSHLFFSDTIEMICDFKAKIKVIAVTPIAADKTLLRE